MIEVIVMPKLGFNMNEGKLVKWYKQENETVKKGESLFAIETDKTNIDVEATIGGVVRKLLINESDTVPVTLPIAIVADADEDISSQIAQAMQSLGKDASPAAAPQAKSAETQLSNPASSLEAKWDFDIIVLGGGPGGYVTAIKAAQEGKKTAIIEKNRFGGVCLNRGCIPTKALLRSAEALTAVRESSAFGVADVDVSKAKLDMKKVQDRKNKVIEQLVNGVNQLLQGNGVTVIQGEGVLTDHHTAQVGKDTYTAEYMIIATGSAVKPLPVKIDNSMKILTSDEVLDLDEAPKDIVIIGGGVIGIEFAYFLSSIGTKVTVVEFLDRILPMVDAEITQQVSKQLEEMGIVIYTSAKVTEIIKDAVLFEKDDKQSVINTSMVLMAVGRVPYLGGLDCDGLGIKKNGDAIAADLSLRTSVPNIYAIGDVNGKRMLAHTASMEGLVAVENICGRNRKMNYDTVPSVIYTQPEISSVGLTEEQAREKYGDVKVGKFPLMANGKAKVAGETRGLVKVILEPKYNEIVGVHLYCMHASDMIAEAVVAMNLESTAEELAMSIHPHPAISEAYHEAIHAALNKAIHFI